MMSIALLQPRWAKTEEEMNIDELLQQVHEIAVKLGRIEERQLVHKEETDHIKRAVSSLVEWKNEISGGNKRLLTMITAAAAMGGVLGAILAWMNGGPK